MTELLHSPLVLAALGGWIVAARIDYAAFRAWKSFEDARAYSWNLAIWRWFQGAVIGAVTEATVLWMTR